MRWRSALIVILLLALGPWARWAWREHDRAGEGEFLRRKLAFLEAENRRLTDRLAAQQLARATEEDARLRRQIEKSVADLRDLPFTNKVVYRQIPRSDLPVVLRKRLLQQVPDQEFTDASVALTALGLLPPGTDLQKTYLGLLGEQIGAFYDQHTQEVFTFSGQPLSNSQNRVILAHELTHALEDQHFHLAKLPLEGKNNDDRAMAASALVEGDATLVMNQYMVGNLSAAVLKDSLASVFTTDLRQLAAAPRYLRESLLFPYLKGQVFCQMLFERGGWDELAKAFRQPPSCTAQILHPERYLATPRWEPTMVKFGSEVALGGKPSSDNVLGEFGTRQLLRVWLGDDEKAANVAAGWKGDRYLVYGDAKANSSLWKSDWVTPEAARQFVQAAKAGWTGRYGLPSSAGGQAPPVGEAVQAETETVLDARLADGRELQIARNGSQVVLIAAQDPAWKRTLEGISFAVPSTSSAQTHAER